MKIHVVKKGDTLYELSKKYGVPLQSVIEANPELVDPNKIDVGMKIKIPSSTTPVKPVEYEIMHKHAVVQGDSLWKLSKAWGVPLQDMILANPQLKNPNVLMTGEVVNIPKPGSGTGGASGENVGLAASNVSAHGKKKSTAPKPEATLEIESAEFPPPAPKQIQKTTDLSPNIEITQQTENLFAQIPVPAKEVTTQEVVQEKAKTEMKKEVKEEPKAKEIKPQAENVPTFPLSPQAENVTAYPMYPQAENMPAHPVYPQAENMPAYPVYPQAENMPAYPMYPQAENMPAHPVYPQAENMPAHPVYPQAENMPAYPMYPQAENMPAHPVYPQAENVSPLSDKKEKSVSTSVSHAPTNLIEPFGSNNPPYGAMPYADQTPMYPIAPFGGNNPPYGAMPYADQTPMYPIAPFGGNNPPYGAMPYANQAPMYPIAPFGGNNPPYPGVHPWATSSPCQCKGSHASLPMSQSMMPLVNPYAYMQPSLYGMAANAPAFPDYGMHGANVYPGIQPFAMPTAGENASALSSNSAKIDPLRVDEDNDSLNGLDSIEGTEFRNDIDDSDDTVNTSSTRSQKAKSTKKRSATTKRRRKTNPWIKE